MVSILMDLSTGDIDLDENNNTIPVDNYYAFRQIIDGLLHCKPGSEILHPTYGFPLEEAIRTSGTETSEMFIESLFVQSLDPQIEKLIKSLDYVKAQRQGREMLVDITLTSVLDDILKTNINI